MCRVVNYSNSTRWLAFLLSFYLILSGDANQVLAELIQRMNLGDLFVAPDAPSGLTVRNYKMNRYIDGYKGIVKMLQSVNGKLNITFRQG